MNQSFGGNQNNLINVRRTLRIPRTRAHLQTRQMAVSLLKAVPLCAGLPWLPGGVADHRLMPHLPDPSQLLRAERVVRRSPTLIIAADTDNVPPRGLRVPRPLINPVQAFPLTTIRRDGLHPEKTHRHLQVLQRQAALHHWEHLE